MAAIQNFSDFTKVPLKFFAMLGSKLCDDGPETRMKRYLKNYFYVSHFSVVVATVFMIVYIKESIDTIPKMAEYLPPFCYTVLSVSKSFSIYATQQTFNDVMETLDELFPKTKEDQATFEVAKYSKGYKRIEKVFVGLVASAAFSLFATNFLKLAFLGGWYDKLPFDNWYPFDEYNPIYFNFVFIWQNTNVVVTVCGLLGSDLIFYSFMTLLSMQFDILAMKFQQLSTKDDLKKFVELMEIHENLLELVKKLERIFAPSILLNFLASSVLICLVGYRVSIDFNLEVFMKSSLMLTVALLQIFSLCHYGNKLTTAAENVSMAAYNSDWVNDDNRKMKTILVMVMQRSQKKTALTAFKFKVLNLEAFTVVSGLELEETEGFFMQYLYCSARYSAHRIRISHCCRQSTENEQRIF
jgi:odorant receptor